jgi:hypothetical protein
LIRLCILLVKFYTSLFIFRLTDNGELEKWLYNIKWTSELAIKWQEFYSKGSRLTTIGGGSHFETELIDILPEYEDLTLEECSKQQTQDGITVTMVDCNSADHQKAEIFVLLVLIPFIMKKN